MILVLALACTGAPDDTADPVYTYPAPDARPPLRGAGGPAVPFAEEDLFAPCAVLEGGPEDNAYHNLVMPYRGHLVMPWAAEWGEGGLSFVDVSDPCAPVKAGDGYEQTMRETHAIGFVHLREDDPNAGDWAVASQARGIVFWDVSDPAEPVVASILELPNVYWPDAYTHVVLSLFWQYPYVYVAAADEGVFVVDARDPRAPELVEQYRFDPGLRAAAVFVLGNRMLVSGSKITEGAMLDVSDPVRPQLYPGGRFELVDAEGVPRESYHASMVGHLGLFTRKDSGGGPIVMDLSDPSDVAFAGAFHDPTAGGGYVFYDEGFIFQGETNHGNVYDARDLSEITLLGTTDLEGDLDTLVPYGNVMIASVDDEAVDDVASVVVPWATAVDDTPPGVLAIDPPDGATAVPRTARVGVGFDEIVEPSSVFAGSVRLYDEDGAAVPGWGGAQETLGYFTPAEPLRPGTTYTVEVLGVTDINGNALDEAVTSTFTTAGP